MNPKMLLHHKGSKAMEVRGVREDDISLKKPYAHYFGPLGHNNLLFQNPFSIYWIWERLQYQYDEFPFHLHNLCPKSKLFLELVWLRHYVWTSNVIYLFIACCFWKFTLISLIFLYHGKRWISGTRVICPTDAEIPLQLWPLGAVARTLPAWLLYHSKFQHF